MRSDFRDSRKRNEESDWMVNEEKKSVNIFVGLKSFVFRWTSPLSSTYPTHQTSQWTGKKINAYCGKELLCFTTHRHFRANITSRRTRMNSKTTEKLQLQRTAMSNERFYANSKHNLIQFSGNLQGSLLFLLMIHLLRVRACNNGKHCWGKTRENLRLKLWQLVGVE
jgi:hypothetical protein